MAQNTITPSLRRELILLITWIAFMLLIGVITESIFALLFIAYFSTSPRAATQEEETRANISVLIVTCYVVEKSLENTSNALWWFNFGSSWFESEEMFANGIANAYDSLKTDASREVWAGAATACAATRVELEKYAEIAYE